jgi:hypothetical protein
VLIEPPENIAVAPSSGHDDFLTRAFLAGV